MPLFRTSSTAKLRKRDRFRTMVRRAYTKLKGSVGDQNVPSEPSISGDHSQSPFANSSLQLQDSSAELIDVNDTPSIYGADFRYPAATEQVASINQHEPTIRLPTITKNVPTPIYRSHREAESRKMMFRSVQPRGLRHSRQFALRPFSTIEEEDEESESSYFESDNRNALIIPLQNILRCNEECEPVHSLLGNRDPIVSAFGESSLPNVEQMSIEEESVPDEESLPIEDDWILVESEPIPIEEDLVLDSDSTIQSLEGLHEKKPESNINQKLVDAIARAPAPKTLGQVVDLSFNCARKVEPVNGIGFPFEIKNLNANPHESDVEVKSDPIRCIPNLRWGLIHENDGENEDPDGVSSDDGTVVAPEAVPELIEQPVLEAPNLPNCESIESSDEMQPDEDRASNASEYEIEPSESDMSSEVVLEVTTDCESNEVASGSQSVEDTVGNLPDDSSSLKRSISSRIYTRFQQLKPQRKPKVNSKCTLREFKLKKTRTLRGALFKSKRKSGIKYPPKPVEKRTRPSDSQKKHTIFGFLSVKSSTTTTKPRNRPSPVSSKKDNWKRQKDERYLTRRLRFLVNCNNLFGAVPANAASCVGKARLIKFTTRRKSLIMRVLHRVSPL